MRYSVAGVLAVFILMAVIGVRDASAMKFGPLVVQPSVEETAAYDDNVFVQNKGSEVDDWYFLTTPGLLLQLRQRDNLYELEYKADIYNYIDTGDANDVDDHFLRGALNFRFPGGLSLKFDDLFSKAHEPRSSSNFAVTGVTTPINRLYSNDFGAEAAYEISDRFKAALSYKFYTVYYPLQIDGVKVNGFRDRDENAGALTVYYKFLPKTSVLAEGIYKNVYHNNDEDPQSATLNSDEYWALVGLTWEITEKSTGTVKGGYEWKQFKFPGRRDFSSPVYQVSINHNFTPKTAVTLTGGRQANETDDPTVAYYATTNGSIQLSYKPFRKIEIGPYVSYTYDRYSDDTALPGLPPARRTDSMWTGGLDAAYNIQKWLAVSVGYTHAKRASNLTLYDYTDNSVMMKVRLSL